MAGAPPGRGVRGAVPTALVVSIAFSYMKLQHGSQHAYQLTWFQILLIDYTVDWLSVGSLLTYDRSPYMTV